MDMLNSFTFQENVNRASGKGSMTSTSRINDREIMQATRIVSGSAMTMRKWNQFSQFN